MLNLTDTVRLHIWNSELVNSLIPDTVVLATYIFLGLCGNGIVIFVYKMRFSRQNVDRYFIPHLAVSDMLNSIVCGSSGIVYNTYPDTFFFNGVCKSFWFFSAFMTYLSIGLLVIIAVQRYLKIVKPHRRQLDMKMNRVILMCTVCASLLVAAPTPALYGAVPFKKPNDTLIGQRCGKIKEGNKAFSIFYGVLMGILALTVVGAIVVIYTRIGWTIFHHVNQQRNASIQTNPVIGSASKTSSIENMTEMSDIRSFETVDMETNLNENHNRTSRILTETRGHCDKKKKKAISSNHSKINQRVVNKFTLMFMLITVIFLICFFPKACLLLLEASNPNFWENLSDRERAGITFVYRMFIINNIANPFVYAFLDTKFKNELASMFCRRKGKI